MKPPSPPLATRIWLVAGAFGTAVVLAASAMLLETRSQALARSDEQLMRALATAETEFNRAMMTLDLTLASLPRVLAIAQLPSGIDAEAAHKALTELQERQLLFTDLALVDETGETLTTALLATRRSGPDVPIGLVALIRSQPVPMLTLSDPVVGRSTGERGLLVGRALDLPGTAPMVALAEMPADLLLPATAANVGSVPGLTVALERSDGQPLIIQPPDESALARRHPQPPPAAASDKPLSVTGHDGSTGRVAARPTLYPGLQLVARRADVDALSAWRGLSLWVMGVAALFLSLIVVATRMAQLQWGRLAQARQEAAAAAEVLDRALEAMGDAFLLCGPDDRVVRWNARYLEMFPWQREVLAPGVPFRSLAELGALERFGGDAQAASAWTEERFRLRRSMVTGHAQQIDLHTGIVASLIERRMPDGGIVSVYHDMTANERQLNRARQEAEAANEAKSQFLANISHEIRTPLNAVLGLNDMLLLGRLDEEQRRLAALVRSSGRLLLALINDILDLARIEAGHFETRDEIFDPSAVAEEVCAMLSERALAQRLVLHVEDHTPHATCLLGDAVRLRQVLLNLVGNALKFTNQGRVTVRLMLTAGPDVGGPSLLRLDVVDTGIGIAPEQVPRLFERFRQIDNSATRRHGGSGLGLAITREVVQRLGGQIRVSSTPGLGSTFSVEIPFRHVKAAEAEAAATAPGALAEERQPLHLLVAEDNAVNQLLIEALLAHLGHRSRVVGNGREAVEEAASGEFDVVLMDMQMPELDGLEATRRIRALDGEAARIPIVAMTANARDEDRQACLDAGMDAFLSKPIEFDELDRLLQAQASRRAAVGRAGARP
jgi:signal transduction histidine kinase/ActR/RegA family two-component response regulator